MEIYVLDIRKIRRKDEKKVEEVMPRRFAYCKNFMNHDDYLRSLGASILMLKHLPFKNEDSFGKTEKGKPYIINGPEFNYSHSGNKVILAVSANEKIGVDVEAIDEENLSFKEQIFPKELEYINKDPLNNFHLLWTKKEAMGKLLGYGLSFKNKDVVINEKDEIVFNGKTVKFISYIKKGYAYSVAFLSNK